jgi:hypothetical protein
MVVSFILVGLVKADAAPQINVISPSGGTWTQSTDVAFDVAVTDISQTYAFINWDSSLAGWWRWEGNANDESLNGNHGTLKGGASYTGGRFGQAVSTNGSDDYISLGDKDEFKLCRDASFTFAIWVYLPQNCSASVVSKGRYSMLLRYRDTIPAWQLDVGYGNASDMRTCTYSQTPSARWTHAAVSYDHFTKTFRLYVDGALRASTVANFAGDFDSAELLELGRYTNASVLIDDFVIFNRVLGASEIAALYEARTQNLATTFGGLVEMLAYGYDVEAVNGSGQRVTSAGSVTVDVPNSAPIGVVTSPMSPTRSSSSSQTFAASVSDTNGSTTLKSATLYWDYGQAFGPTAYADSLSGNSDTVSIPVSGLSDGTITWNLYLEDSAGDGGFIAQDQTLVIGQSVYYVAPTGDDGQPGTIDRPFRTIQAFADIALPGDTCYIRAGTYRETVTPARSGHASAPITYQAYPGETVTISGVDPVSGAWTQHSGSIYRTTSMNWDLGTGRNQIFVDGVAMIEARWPNTDDIMQPNLESIDSGSTVSGSTLTLRDADLTQGSNYWVGGIIHGIWDVRYHAATAQINASTSGQLTATLDCGNRGDPSSNGEYYIVGPFSQLDQAGEWFYDGGSSTLYLWTLGGGTPANHFIEAKARDVAFNCDGLSHIIIKDVGVFGANLTTDADSSHLVVDGIVGRYLSHYTVIDEGDMGDGQKGTRDSGIVLDGKYNTLRNSTIDYSAGNGVSLIGDSCSVINCEITNTNYVVTGCGAVCTGLAKTEDNIISNNTLHYTGRNLVVHTSADNITITYNDLAYNRRGWEPWDLGATYCIGTDGKGSTIAFNRIHDIRSIGIYLDNANWNFNVHHNVVWNITGTAKGIGMLMNMPSQNHRVFNNTFADTVIKLGFSGGTEGTEVRNNICSELSDIAANGGAASNNIVTRTYSINPQFVDPANGDFHLQTTSPAVNAGIGLGFTHDIEGNPIVGVPDIGAYEYTATPMTCTITASVVSGGGTISPSGFLSISPGNDPTFTMQAATDYRIDDVLVDGVSVGGISTFTFNNVSASHTIQASFASNKHVAYVSAVNGSVTKTPDQATYDTGDAITLQATANNGYHFADWSGDLTSSNNPATLVMDDDKAVTANFAINTYTLSINATNGSVVRIPDKSAYNYGESVSLQAVPDAHYGFGGWSGDLSSGNNPVALVMDSHKTVTATFTHIPDSAAPTVTNCSPQPNAIQVPVNQLVTLHITDGDPGVNADTVTITVDGVTVYSGNVASYSTAGGVCRRTGTANDYLYAYQSSRHFDVDEPVDVVVTATDLDGNAMVPYTFSFRTEMWAFGSNHTVSWGPQALEKGCPATVCDSNGDIWVAYHAGPAGKRDVYVCRRLAQDTSFSGFVQLTSDGGDQCCPDIAVDVDDKLYVVWQDNRRGDWDIYGATSDDGAVWSAATRVGGTDDGQIAPAVAVNAQSPSTVYLAWQDDRAGHQDVYVASSGNGFATAAVTQVTSNAFDQTDPDIAVDASGTVYVVWTDDRNGSDDIYGASSANGPWADVALINGAGDQHMPAVATEATGSLLHFAWVDDTSGDSDVWYASSSPMPATPSAPRNVVDDTSGADQLAPTLFVTGSTGADLQVFVCWQDWRNYANGTDTDLYFVQTKTGVETNVLVGDGSTRSNQSAPVLGVDRYGYPYLVWTDGRNIDDEIYFAGASYTNPVVTDSQLVNASTGGTVGVAPPSQISDASVAIPGGSCPHDVTITIAETLNPPSVPAGTILAYDFAPSGLQFSQSVTITIPYLVADYPGSAPDPYWYDPQTGSLSQAGISGIETLDLSETMGAIRFETTHFTTYGLLDSSLLPSGGGGGGGGGGGCALAPGGPESPAGFLLPYVMLAIILTALRLHDRKARLGRKEPSQAVRS